MSEYPAVTPYLLYHDVAAALQWLGDAFGFRERLRYNADDGTVNHAEMFVGDGLVMLGNPGPDFRNPDELGGVTHYTSVYVDDLDAHFTRAKAAGARINRPIAEEAYGDRRYDAVDLEGHHWSFSEHVRDVAPQDWGATVSR